MKNHEYKHKWNDFINENINFHTMKINIYEMMWEGGGLNHWGEKWALAWKGEGSMDGESMKMEVDSPLYCIMVCERCNVTNLVTSSGRFGECKETCLNKAFRIMCKACVSPFTLNIWADLRLNQRWEISLKMLLKIMILKSFVLLKKMN